MKNFRNVLGALFATLVFYVCQWQLDLWCSPYVWREAHRLEVLPFLFMPSTWAYCIGFLGLNVAFWIGLVSLWFWVDDQKHV